MASMGTPARGGCCHHRRGCSEVLSHVELAPAGLPSGRGVLAVSAKASRIDLLSFFGVDDDSGDDHAVKGVGRTGLTAALCDQRQGCEGRRHRKGMCEGRCPFTWTAL